MKVAIHQPNFLPWLGFFHKIQHCDSFILLDDVVVNIKTPTWFKRVFVNANGVKKPMTLPLVKGDKGSFQKITDIEIGLDDANFRKQRKTLDGYYQKHPHYEIISTMLDAFYSLENASLSEKNLTFIQTVCEHLQITTPILKSSDLNADGKSNELLINLIHAVDGDTYLSGGGSEGYQEDELFENAGIEVEYQSYAHPEYPQPNTVDFLPGLSIIDSLASVGIESTSKMIIS